MVKVRSYLVAVFMACLLAAACTPTPTPKPVVDPQPRAPCAEACASAQDACGADYLSPKTGTCAQACQNAEDRGLDFRSGCLLAAKGKGCDAVKACSGQPRR